MPIARRALLAGTAGLLAAPAIVRAQGQNGVALVIGNSQYKWESSLPNVKRDVADVARHFRAMGLKTEQLENLGHDAMKRGLAKFAGRANGANFAVIYFAGHGIYWEKSSLLVPVDADLSDPGNVRPLFSLSYVVKTMKGAAHNMLGLDCCRNNPAEGWRQRYAEELAQYNVLGTGPGSTNAQLRANPHSLWLYSTAPGRIALDGPAGENSPFASAVMRQLERDPVDLQALAGRVRRDLLLATQGRQVSWDLNAYDQPFVVGGARGATGGAAPSLDPSSLVEFDKAYAYARQHSIPLPDGLVGVRPPNSRDHRQKIGSFTFEANTDGGPHVDLAFVLSVDDSGSATVIMAGNNSKAHAWRLVNGVVSGDRLDVKPRNAVAPRFVFDWRDANSGSVSLIWETAFGRPFTGSFSRLDG